MGGPRAPCRAPHPVFVLRVVHLALALAPGFAKVVDNHTSPLVLRCPALPITVVGLLGPVLISLAMPIKMVGNRRPRLQPLPIRGEQLLRRPQLSRTTCLEVLRTRKRYLQIQSTLLVRTPIVIVATVVAVVGAMAEDRQVAPAAHLVEDLQVGTATRHPVLR